MNKEALVLRLGRESGLTRGAVVRAVRALVAAIREAVQSGDKISLTGLGTFRVKARKGRPGRNPKTGEPIAIPAGRKISFKPSLSFKRLVKG